MAEVELGGSNKNGMLPRTAFVRWLVGTGRSVSPAIQALLIQGLYGTLAIFFGGLFNTILLSTLIAIRHPTPAFIAWPVAELLLAMLRVPTLVLGRKAAERGRAGPIDLYIGLGLVWSASVGYGCFVSLTSGDWIAAVLAGVSAAGMVGGMCFRYYGAPRLVAVMIALSLGPCALGGIFSGIPILLITCIQLPLYMLAMTMACYQLNGMLVRTMEAEQESAHRAQHDVLTGLLNRAGLERVLAGRQSGEACDRTTFFYIDLDGFKAVNDTFGHGIGDRLLAAVADRLRASVRPTDAIARLGGDEFLVVTDHADRASARRTGERLVAALSDQPYLLGDEAALIGACVGIAMLPEDGADFETLITKADAALYEAKARGGARCALPGWDEPRARPPLAAAGRA